MATTRFIPYNLFAELNSQKNHSSREVVGILPYSVAFTPSSHNYYLISEDRQDTIASFTVKNTGTEIIPISGYTLAKEFTLLTPLPSFLFPDEVFEFDIEFNPTESGNIFRTFSLKSKHTLSGNSLLLYGESEDLWDHVAEVDGMLNSLWVFLQASVQDPLLDDGPYLNLFSTNYGFENHQMINTTSSPIQITLQNSGTQPLILSDFAVTGNFRIVP